MVKNTVHHSGAHSNTLLFRTHLPMRFADGFLIFVSLSVYIPTRCCAFAVKPNINHGEYVFEIVRVYSLLFHVIQFLQEQFLFLVSRQFFTCNAIVSDIEGVRVVAQYHQMSLELE